MILKFDSMEEKVNPKFNGGEGVFKANMLVDERNKILRGKLEPGCSIGYHKHDTSSEIIYVLSGTGKMLIEDGEERLNAGDCHYCMKGQSHSFINDSDEDLIFFAVVPQQ
ncbi:MAG: cupin domain-containing protein [Lachnospiraceae bacterium]|nr:cupin domain-containing protein [Lachnospiraceae bacterium]